MIFETKDTPSAMLSRLGGVHKAPSKASWAMVPYDLVKL